MKRTLIHAFIRMFPIYTVEALYEMFYRICIRNNTLLQSVLRFIEYLAFMPFSLALRMYHLLIKRLFVVGFVKLQQKAWVLIFIMSAANVRTLYALERNETLKILSLVANMACHYGNKYQ